MFHMNYLATDESVLARSDKSSGRLTTFDFLFISHHIVV